MFGFCTVNVLSAKYEAVNCVAHSVLLSLPCIVSLCHAILLSLPCLTGEEGIVTYYLRSSALLIFWMWTYQYLMLKYLGAVLKECMPIIIYTNKVNLVFFNDTTPQISFLLCFNVVGLNCFERKCEYEFKFGIWRNTKIISICLVFQP